MMYRERKVEVTPGPTTKKAKKGLPERWLEAPAIGHVVADIFVPFKSPMCDLYRRFLPDDKSTFTVDDVLNHTNLESRRIALWLDLTLTDRYYDKSDVIKSGCFYHKLPIDGNKRPPTREDVQHFNSKHPNNLIGVHCTHGLNRTGFLICAYLIANMNYTPEKAVALFAEKRQGGIEKKDYILELRRYAQGRLGA